jgi:hypothetical protein
MAGGAFCGWTVNGGAEWGFAQRKFLPAGGNAPTPLHLAGAEVAGAARNPGASPADVAAVQDDLVGKRTHCLRGTSCIRSCSIFSGVFVSAKAATWLTEFTTTPSAW